MASLELPFGIKVLNPTSVDAKYLNDGTPYISVAEANSVIGSGIRHIGLTVNILGVEYWYKDGILDGDLIIKSGGGTGSGERVEKTYTQTAHGFSIGDIVAYENSGFVKAIADGSQSGETIGFVSEITDANIFTVVFSGYIEGISALGLNPSTTYFLSTTTAGTVTPNDTQTFNTISKPVLSTLTTDDAVIYQYRGFLVENGITEGNKEIILSTDAVVNVLDTNVNTLFVASGTTTFNLPTTPIDGAELVFVDAAGTAGAITITIDGNGKNIYDLSSTTVTINTNYGSITLIYNGVYWNVTAFV